MLKSGNHSFFFKPTGPREELTKRGFRVVVVMPSRSTAYQFHVEISKIYRLDVNVEMKFLILFTCFEPVRSEI